ncbi:MAG: hypothetical protein FJ026_02535, partial [Chloroflexi bacterium]|nr:hypothetical protein [Chloroflexota bacterium]
MQANAEQILTAGVYDNGMNQPAFAWSPQPDPGQASIGGLVHTTICAQVHDLGPGRGDGDVMDIQVFETLTQGSPGHSSVFRGIDPTTQCPHIDHVRTTGSNGQGQHTGLYPTPVKARP